MKHIIAILAGLLLIGLGGAQLPEQMPTYWQFTDVAFDNLYQDTPAFAGAWGQAVAKADPWEFGEVNGLKTLAYTNISILDPTGAKNMVVDPSAATNMVGASVSALSAKAIDLSDKSQPWVAYAAAGGIAQSQVDAIDQAWTVATMDLDTIATPQGSMSSSTVAVLSLADPNYMPGPQFPPDPS
jgi:hypothetical protein